MLRTGNFLSSLMGCLLTICFFNHGLSQSIELKLKSGTVEIERSEWSLLQLQPQKYAAYGEFNAIGLLVFDKLPSVKERAFFSENGVELIEYVTENTWLVGLKSIQNETELQKVPIHAFIPLEAEWKIHPYLNLHPETEVVISLFPGINLSELDSQGNWRVEKDPDLPKGYYKVNIKRGEILDLAELPGVKYIYPNPGEDEPLRYRAEGTQRVHSLKSNIGLGLTGKGITMGVGDGGNIGFHVDLNEQITDLTVGNRSTHAAHVSGIIGGRPWLRPNNGEGMAPNTHMLSQNFSDIIDEGYQYFEDYDMRITNNSYGNQLGNCDIAGDYNFLAEFVDIQTSDLPSLLHVFSSGNDGNNNCDPYSGGYGTILSSYQSSKNALVVGNANHLDVLRGSSSSGPTKDGRLKPEVVGVGTSVLSTNSTNGYRFLTGTSMSSPMVAGISSLLYEYFRERHGRDPSSSLLKVILANNADDRGNPLPDYRWGFGRVNARRSMEALSSLNYVENSIVQGEMIMQDIEIPAGIIEFRAMLAWTDLPGAPFSNPVLVNDLDLFLIHDGDTIRPWVLNPHPDSVGLLPLRKRDGLNNIEQVTIELPEPGIYTIVVQGSRVVNASQEYSMTWTLRENELVLTYPIGGEVWRTGSGETVRWDYGIQDSDTVILEISTDGGQNWDLVTDSTQAGEIAYGFTTPGTFTHIAKMRIRERNGNLVSESGLFTILPAPGDPGTYEFCKGQAVVHWPPLAGVDSFEIYRLDVDRMTPVGFATDTMAVVQLHGGEDTYFAVAAHWQGVSGRRSPAILASQGQGSCPFNQDIELLSFDTPIFGRMFTSSQFGTEEEIILTVRNNGMDTIQEFVLSYQVGNGGIHMDTIANQLIPGQEYIHSFSTREDFSGLGLYNLSSWVSVTGDPNLSNDSIKVVLYHADNQPITLPYKEDFETGEIEDVRESEYAIAQLDRLDYTHSGNGRMRTFAGSNYAFSGTKALTMDAFPNGSSNGHRAILTFNLSQLGADSNNIRMNFAFAQHEEFDDEDQNDQMWIRGSDKDPFIAVYDFNSHKVERGVYKNETSAINLPFLLEQNGQSFSSSFQIALEQSGEGRTNVPGQINGLSFDDFEFFTVDKDVRPLTLDFPLEVNCGLDVASPQVTIENTDESNIIGTDVSYRVNDGPWSTPVKVDIEARTTLTLDLPEFDFSEYGLYSVDIAVHFPEDSYRDNDTLTNIEFLHLPFVNQYPYLENFEEDNGGWFSYGERNSWEWGAPEMDNINKAAEGKNAWATNLTGDHNDRELSYLISPCFDLTSLENPMISFAHAYDMEIDFDYLWVEISDGIGNWQKLGSFEEGHNWYNVEGVEAWDNRRNDWHVASILIPLDSLESAGSVRFRFVLDSDQFVTEEGGAVDMVHIHEHIPIETERSFTGGATLNGDNMDFLEDGKISARLSPASSTGSFAGLISYPIDTILPNDGAKVYYNKSFHIDGVATGPLTVGLFLQEDSVLQFLADTCNFCGPLPRDPFGLAATRFNGNNEDLILKNNYGSRYTFYPSNSILTVPYATGYVLQIPTDELSEFYIHADADSAVMGGIGKIEAFRSDSLVDVHWNGLREVDVWYYLVERSLDSFQSDIIVVDSVRGINDPLESPIDYKITDTLTDIHAPKIWYRIRTVRLNTTSFLTPYVLINRTSIDQPLSESEWMLYPNPNNGRFKLEWEGKDQFDYQLRITDLLGRTVFSRNINGTISLDLPLQPGVYYVTLFRKGKYWTGKMVVE